MTTSEKRREIIKKVLREELREKGLLRHPGSLVKISRELGVPVKEVRCEINRIIKFYACLTKTSEAEIERDCLGAVLLVEVDDFENFLQEQYRQTKS